MEEQNKLNHGNYDNGVPFLIPKEVERNYNQFWLNICNEIIPLNQKEKSETTLYGSFQKRRGIRYSITLL